MKNVILIGMPGAGKTTVGTYLSELLGYGYVDSDSVIVAREGKRLNELIAEYGREKFLDIEAKVNAQITASRCVIATGGSVVYRPYAIESLKKTGIVVYLELSCEELFRRLGDLTERGVVLKAGKTFQDLYDERVPLYRAYADITVRLDGMTVEEAANRIAEALYE